MKMSTELPVATPPAEMVTVEMSASTALRLHHRRIQSNRLPGGCTLGRSLADRGDIAVIRNPKGRRSDLIVSPRGNGGCTITQGPVHVLIGPEELGPLLEAIATYQGR
jgi:hypothetical protein